jgi:hypothetical protein
MQPLDVEEAREVTMDVRLVGTMKEGFSKSKIFTYFFKGKISLSPLETILSIPRKSKYLERFMKLTWKKRDESFKTFNMMKLEDTPTI